MRVPFRTTTRCGTRASIRGSPGVSVVLDGLADAAQARARTRAALLRLACRSLDRTWRDAQLSAIMRDLRDLGLAGVALAQARLACPQ